MSEATVADLIEVLRSLPPGQHGPWRSVWFEESGGGYAIPLYEDTEPGTYLVYRIEEEK